MRIRILSQSEQTNLPVIRSWFNVDRESTVTSLKLSLCASLPALRDARVRAEELVLTLDDFELLNGSPINILRDGDLIWYAEHVYPFIHLIDGRNSLRRRTHLPKRRAEDTEDNPRKRRRPLPVANSTAAGGHAPVGGTGLNGFNFPKPGHLGGDWSIKLSSSSSSSSDTSSNTSSDDTSSNSESSSESTSGSSSDSDSDSDSTSPFFSDDLRRRVPRPPPSIERQKKPSQPRYVTSMLSRVYQSAAFVPQACPSTARIWESADP